MGYLLSFIELWAAPFLSVVVSLVYFLLSPVSQSVTERLAVSSHGFIIATMYLGAMCIWWSGASSDAYVYPFWLLLFVPFSLMIFSFFRFRGPRVTHLLQFFNLIGLFWAFFVGGMAVSGDWI